MEHQKPILSYKNRRKQRIVVIIILLILAGGSAGYFFYKKDNRKPLATVKKEKTDSLKMDTLLSDSTKREIIKQNPLPSETEEEPTAYSERYVIQPATVNGRHFRFGDKVFVNDERSDDEKSFIYLRTSSGSFSATALPINSEILVSESQYEEYRQYFSLSPFSELDLKTKKLLLSETYSNGTTYKITQNAERARSTICFGDFDADGKKDVAIITDNNEMQKSRLLIICTNTATQEKYLAFSENYSDKMKVNSFKKGAKVIMNTPGLTPAPADGIILRAEDVKLAIMYDLQLQKFKTYYQE
ncbi:hypothetical protein [Sphingobacterium spiritivorum]|uniref:hypothetical protein n=1 Tax=Sphingobacterium spiritivorum TaxID=258 RepID=UPI001919362E|nr:hypothetical protein [Sphingobacterium spiritivorum]QQS97461.1 hypothetical protein I6J03_07070 [Sphingobacterium spiritivorum]